MQQPQDPHIVQFGDHIAKEMTQTKSPDPAAFVVSSPRDPILIAMLKSIHPDLGDAEGRNHTSCNWPGVDKYTFYFKKIKTNGVWEWKFTEYVKLP